MKLVRTVASALAATSLLAAPIAAQAAAPAERSSTDVSGESLRGGWVIPLLALIAVAIGLYIAFEDENRGVSP